MKNNCLVSSHVDFSHHLKSFWRLLFVVVHCYVMNMLNLYITIVPKSWNHQEPLIDMAEYPWDHRGSWTASLTTKKKGKSSVISSHAHSQAYKDKRYKFRSRSDFVLGGFIANAVIYMLYSCILYCVIILCQIFDILTKRVESDKMKYDGHFVWNICRNTC